MKVLVIGAHHGLGAQVLRCARERGHEALAFAGDVLDRAHVERSVDGQQAVFSTLGPRATSPANLCSAGTQNIVDAMLSHGVRRLIAVSGALIGHPQEHLGWLYRRIRASLPSEMLADRRKQESIIQHSRLEWTLIRPTRLTDGRARGVWQASEDAHIGALARISRADAAAAMVQCLEQPASIHRALTLLY